MIVSGHNHISAALVTKAESIISSPANYAKVTVETAEVRCHRYYVNFRAHFGLTVTEARCRGARTDPVGCMSFTAAKLQFNSLHAVTIISSIVTARQTRMTCSCKHYWRSGYLCAHILACYHLEKSIDLTDYLRNLEPVKPRGRPPKRTSALAMEVDQFSPDLAKRFKNIDMRSEYVRGAGQYNGLLTGICLGKAKTSDKTTVLYKVNFPDATPPTVVEEMSLLDFILCVKEHKKFVKCIRVVV